MGFLSSLNGLFDRCCWLFMIPNSVFLPEYVCLHSKGAVTRSPLLTQKTQSSDFHVSEFFEKRKRKTFPLRSELVFILLVCITAEKYMVHVLHTQGDILTPSVGLHYL